MILFCSQVVMSDMTHSGALVWLLRCERPNCCIALSADQGSSSVRWHRRRWFFTLH